MSADEIPSRSVESTPAAKTDKATKTQAPAAAEPVSTPQKNTSHNNDEGDAEANASSANDASSANATTSSDDDTGPQIVAPRDYMQAPLRKLSVKLLDTYRHINQVYYRDKQARRQKASWDDKHDNYIIKAGEKFSNDRFVLMSQVGKGSFGVVAYALDRENSDRKVAIKIIKAQRPFAKQAQTEIKLLEFMRQQNPEDNHGIVRLIEHFKYRSHVCLVFEMLDHNLYEVIKKTEFRGLSLKVVSHFAAQLLDALGFLLKHRIIHCDLKPENILLCPDLKSSKIKIIDFGSSCYYKEKMYEYIQSRFYRSPEVLLGLGYDEAIDMWSLGCILYELHTGTPIFGGQSEEMQMRFICSLLGLPPLQMLHDAKPVKLNKMFVKIEDSSALDVGAHGVDGKQSEGEAPTSAPAATGGASPESTDSDSEDGARKVAAYRLKQASPATTLRKKLDLDKGGPSHWRQAPEQAEVTYKPFIDLLQKMLTYSPVARLKPDAGLQHPFITEDQPNTSVDGAAADDSDDPTGSGTSDGDGDAYAVPTSLSTDGN